MSLKTSIGKINKQLLNIIKGHTTTYTAIMAILLLLEIYLDFSLIYSILTILLKFPVEFLLIALYLLSPLSYIGAIFPLSLLLAVSIFRLMVWYSEDNKIKINYEKIFHNNKMIYALTGVTAFAMFLMFLI